MRLEQALAAFNRSDNPQSAVEAPAPAAALDLNALRALTLLTEIAVELDIAESLLALGAQDELGVWPIADETADAVRIVRLQLLAYNLHLLHLRTSIEPYGSAEPARGLTALLDRLYEELELIQGAMRSVVSAHAEDADTAPAVHDLDRARRILVELMDAVEAFVLPDGAGVASALVDTPWREFIMLDHMYHAAVLSCLAMNCTGDDRYGAMTMQERTALRYTASEIDVLRRHTSLPPVLADPACLATRLAARAAFLGAVQWWLVSLWERMRHWQHGGVPEFRDLPVRHQPVREDLLGAIEAFRELTASCLSRAAAAG